MPPSGLNRRALALHHRLSRRHSLRSFGFRSHGLAGGGTGEADAKGRARPSSIAYQRSGVRSRTGLRRPLRTIRFSTSIASENAIAKYR